MNTWSLEQLFTEREEAYRPVPWWAWMGDLEPERLHAQLREMHAQGIREFFIFPLYGLEVEYMSEPYLEAIVNTLCRAEELGMQVWIYDEYNWPSGTAAGRVPHRHPEAIGWLVRAHYYEAVSPALQAELQADPAIVHACVMRGATVESADVTRLPADFQQLVVYRLQRDATHDLTIMGSRWCRDYRGMTDTLSPTAVQSYIEEAYAPIERHCARYFGTILKGFFTDEPSLPFDSKTQIPWSPALPEQFTARYGYDLRPCLHDLTFDTPTSERTRRDFWALITHLMVNAYTDQLSRWCAQRGLLFTGHMIEEENPQSVIAHGDTPAHLRAIQYPGCDLLTFTNNYDRRYSGLYGDTRKVAKTPKIASSAARAASRKRVMCEAFGVVPWTRTMAQEKRQGDWLMALGVNLINDNSLLTDLHGFRKRMISGKHFTQPWWPFAHLYYAYAGRVCALVTETALDTRVAVLYPTTSWWVGTRVGLNHTFAEAYRRMEHCDTLDAVVDALIKQHWDFEFLFEDLLASARVQAGVLVTDMGEYDTLVLADIRRLPADAAARLEEFSRAGGRVILVGDQPLAMEPDGNRPLQFTANTTTALLADDRLPNALDAQLRAADTRVWVVEGAENDGLITAARSDAQDRKLCFISNLTPGDKVLTLRWTFPAPIDFWDAATGHRWRPSQTTGACRFTLPEGESVIAVQAVSEPPASEPPIAFRAHEAEPALILDGPWDFRVEPANLCSLSLRLLPDPNGSLTPDRVADQPNDAWVRVAWDDAGIPLEPEKLAYYWLKAEFTGAAPANALHLVVDSADVEEAFLNGQSLGTPSPLTVWDGANRAWPLERCVIPGVNQLLLKVRTSEYNSPALSVSPTHFVEPVVLRGAFTVTESEDIARLAPPATQLAIGDWRQQGYPHFAGTGIYEREFIWDGPTTAVIIACNAADTVVEAMLDGVSLGERAWGSRRFLAPELSPGRHVLQLRITNTLGNLLRHTFGVYVLESTAPAGLLEAVNIYVA